MTTGIDATFPISTSGQTFGPNQLAERLFFEIAQAALLAIESAQAAQLATLDVLDQLSQEAGARALPPSDALLGRAIPGVPGASGDGLQSSLDLGSLGFFQDPLAGRTGFDAGPWLAQQLFEACALMRADAAEDEAQAPAAQAAAPVAKEHKGHKMQAHKHVPKHEAPTRHKHR